MKETMRTSDRAARYALAALVVLAALLILCFLQRDWAGAAVLLLFALLDIGVLIAYSVVRKRDEDSAPRVAARAVVKARYVDKTAVFRGSYMTFFYLVLQLDKAGERRFEVSPADYERIKPGDEGGLIYQGVHMIAFEPDGLRLMPEAEEE